MDLPIFSARKAIKMLHVEIRWNYINEVENEAILKLTCIDNKD
jgi:hypothetical protein